MSNVDWELGLEVHKMLLHKGLESPMLNNLEPGWLSQSKRKEEIEQLFSKIMTCIGLTQEDDSLKGTPARVAKMFTSEIFNGLDYANFPRVMTIDNKMNYDEVVVEKKIAVKSFCEHHFVAIDGYATVGYLPDQKVVGLSKINRVVDFFSRRPQVQERLTEQIHATLCYILGTADVAVLIDASHLCVKHRGVQDHCSSTITSKLGGSFKDNNHTRAEFMSLQRG
jgi:GTP cyclohydrolase I